LWKVIEALALSPILGFVFAAALYFVCRRKLKDPHLYEPATDRPPIWWLRGILILTCSGVSFAHGTNDGQKSIGLIMLTIIGIFPATYALNPAGGQSLADIAGVMQQAEPLVRTYGDDEKAVALIAIESIQRLAGDGQSAFNRPVADAEPSAGRKRLAASIKSATAQKRTSVRDDVYQVISQLKRVEGSKTATASDKKQAQDLAIQLRRSVEYAPLWVRMLSAICLGIGTLFGYKRIVKTLGERLGNAHLTPAQGASTEVVAALLIGTAGFTGLPVSTTHIVASGIAGTMVTSGAGLRYGMVSRIAIAWVLTLPVTILIAGGLYYLLTDPTF
jgi:PiT family inorganic phosphate transporter